MAKHPDADLYRCSSCTHCFSDPDSVDAEAYDAEYFDDDHQRWFAHPNTPLFRAIAATLPQGASVIDVGCGRGDFLRYLRTLRRDLDLTGVDVAPNMPAEGIHFYQADFLTVNLGRQFDAVVSLAVIEHIADIQTFVERLKHLVKPSGIVTVMTLNESSLLFGLARVGRRMGVALAFNRLYSGHHLHHFTRRSLRRLLQERGFRIESDWTHNMPLAAIDIPVANRVADAVLRSGMWVVGKAGDATGRAYLQTISCRKPVDHG
jgi:2-polyprenyl-3-methyl-5-hydroxy-6-metoxy-1,4-benzoquinol methylase